MFSLVITDGGRSNGGATAESFESSIDDFSGFVVDLNLELHHIAARRGPHQTRPHARVVLVKRSNVPGVVVVIHNPLVVQPRRNPNPKQRRFQNPLCAHSQHVDLIFPFTRHEREECHENGKENNNNSLILFCFFLQGTKLT